MIKLLRKSAVVLALSVACATLVLAASPRPQSYLLAVTNGAVSMDQAVQMVEQRYHARVVKAQTLKEEGRTVYVLRLLDDAGKVWTVRVNAANGAVL